tara:strand:- start:939 stop:1436 length:498 start_codon:yes stop_codon:yes gene_type:complete
LIDGSLFVRLQRPIGETSSEFGGETGSNGTGDVLEGDFVAGLFEADGVGFELIGERFPQPIVPFGQQFDEPLVLGADEERAVLERGPGKSALGTPDEFPAFEDDLVLGRARETGGGEVFAEGGRRGAAARFEPGVDAERPDACDEASTDRAVSVLDGGAYVGILL